MFGLPGNASATELNVAKRWAVGLSATPLLGYGPTVEYWTSENLGLSASVGWDYYWWLLGLRGTYLFNTPVHILEMPARPYVGAELGFTSQNVHLGSGRYNNTGLEVFGGLLQPLSDRLSVRAELEASSYSWYSRSGYHSPSSISIGLGIFYHFGH
jgi:hypothetical protein